MNGRARNIIIGLDGVPYELLKDLSDSGVMPNVGALIQKGTFRKMSSSIPEVSSVAWSSIITGANPAEHGIFGFTDIPPNTYRLSFPNFDNLKVTPFWEKDNNSKHVLLNIPATYPARKVNGVLISGFVALDLEKAVYPEDLIPNLAEIDYKIDVDSEKAHRSLELFIKDLNRTNEARIAAYRHLWVKEWDTFMLVFTGTDRLMHFLWDAYEDEGHKHNADFKNFFKRIDESIGEILSRVDDSDNVIILSDHGFEKLEMDVYVNTVLIKGGMLKLKEGAASNYSNIDHGTKAFALDPARIYINLKDKYPRGSVDPKDKKSVIHDIIRRFENLLFEGTKVIRNIYKKEEVYRGRFMDMAPDIVLVGNKGFNLKASLASGEIFSKGVFTGKHSQHNAFILINKKELINIPEYPSVSDVIGIINSLNGGGQWKANSTTENVPAGTARP
ncbi:MAG: alkaline phosphatase family protein [Candidatus Omnitrophica bacterium]|nr:alkaline phosphatase family protein [Candidatus Omnitrophota bacterium]